MEKLNRFIGLNFIRSTGGDNRVYEYFYDYVRINLDFSNCAFMSSPAITNPFVPIFSGNSSGCVITELNFTNCSFLQKFEFLSENENWSRGVYTNCAFKDTSTMNYKSNIGNVDFDNIYNIISEGWKNTGIGNNPDGTQANIGVYGGEFAWRNLQSKEENISLNKSSLTLKEGNSEKLAATTTPSAVDVTWSSSDETVAAVDSNGNVKAIKEGQVTITAQIKGTDTKATCEVTVTKEDIVEPEEPSIENRSLYIEMIDGNIKRADKSQIEKFKKWFISRDLDETESPIFKIINAKENVEYLVHDKVVGFEIRE
ncbi:Ig-like domain-containing protein [Clostridium cagae]|uniref:Ig-like domain-containing protein n=1 Tax=Clostridium cagae TaxID=2080751 RepID=UPI003F76FC85